MATSAQRPYVRPTMQVPRYRAAPPPRPYEAPLGTLSVMALAFGLGVLGYFMLDGHAHTCEACGHHWRHLGAFNVGDPASHTCKQCGTVQWWKDGMRHVFRDVLRPEPPPFVPPPSFGAPAPSPQLAIDAQSSAQGVLR